MYTYATAALNKCIEVIYIQHMKVLLYNQPDTVLKPIFFRPEASDAARANAKLRPQDRRSSFIQQRIQALSGYCGLVKIDWFIK